MSNKAEEIKQFFSKKAAVESVTFLWEGKSFFFDVLREDALHLSISGNKFRKLKYPLLTCVEDNYKGIVTMGGAYSNHLDATSYAGKKFNIPVVCLVRGEEPDYLSHTLQAAKKRGTQLVFISREEYRNIREEGLSENWKNKYVNFLFLPEGGASEDGIKGCAEMVDERFSDYENIAVAAGTGSTAAGILSCLNDKQNLLAFSVLKGGFMEEEILKITPRYRAKLKVEHNLAHFGGYAKTTSVLFNFINEFYAQTNIPLDPIYNGKALFALVKILSENEELQQQKTLYIHTGGLQGAKGFKQLQF